MSTLAIIPARFGATRLPGKPLAKQTGKYLVQHVYERTVSCAAIDRVAVATDDDRIAQAVASFGGEVVMTSPGHATGTDRIGEAAVVLGASAGDLVLNVQGDEPEIDPDSLARLLTGMSRAAGACSVGTLAAPFPDDGPRSGPGSPLDPACVKVVLGNNGQALYFSRSAIPYPRDTGGMVDKPSRWLLHMGVYAFRADALRALTSGPVRRHPLEVAESLEQLRWLASGLAITVVVVERASVGIDTPEDYAAFVARWSGRTGGRQPAGLPGR
ncbi:MAG: 3-deoxy-manno-octulosonate cytidylyltransferase [Planctomycetes bacterium]|nr:3-deoxy-manno-octulosonate cytidylyltransferase [Planctomycetota bacterium]